MSNAETLVPPSYDALTAEVYNSLDFVTERATLIPEQEEAEELVDSTRKPNCAACQRGRCNWCERDD